VAATDGHPSKAKEGRGKDGSGKEGRNSALVDGDRCL